MNAMALDTLKLARSLRDKAKLPPDQAEGFAAPIAKAMQGDLATKSDLEVVRGDIREVDLKLSAEIKDVRGEIEDVKVELASRIREAELRLEKGIEASKAEILKWMFGSIGVQTLAILGAVFAFARMLRP